MGVEFIGLAKTFAGKLLSVAWQAIKGKIARIRARDRAMKGEDLSKEGTLERIIKDELKKLTKSPSALPLGLQGDSFREWLLTDKCLQQFIQVLISSSGDDPKLAEHALDDLAKQYEQATGESRKLASGPLNLVVSLVAGQLQATEDGRQTLDKALVKRTAAGVLALQHPELRTSPTRPDIVRLQTLSAQLQEAGRATWRMPAFLAPLTLEVHNIGDDRAASPINPAQLVKDIEAGAKVVLFGDGGIGKTTFLLELASLCTPEAGQRIPLYVDAAPWAESRVGMLDYIAGSPQAQALGLSPGELARFAKGGFLALIVNGWNEIPADRKAYCHSLFNFLTSTAPDLAVVVASRTPHDTANLPTARRVAVRGLTWQGLSAVIRAELGEKAAHSLLDVLSKDTRRRHAARSPLVLRGLIAQAKGEGEASATLYDLLGAVITDLEKDGQRRLILAEAPLFSLQQHYLEELACRLNVHGATNLSIADALSSIGIAANRLVAQHILGPAPAPATILDILSSQHVLHTQDGLVRFAHQRFQEYFAASRLLHICTTEGESVDLLKDAVNKPAWADSVALVAENLKPPVGAVAARVRLVRAAAAVDLSYASDLAGLSAFGETDDPTLYRQLVSRINELYKSPLSEVQNLGTACQIASRFPAFAESLWPLLESDDQHTRLYTHRLNGSPVSIVQLGPQAAKRISGWHPARRSELMHEIADNPDNYDFLVEVAHTDASPDVRAAAISALFWNFPASTAAVNAWLSAPLEVQTSRDLINYIDYALEQDVKDHEIREQLRVIGVSDVSHDIRLQLALVLPDEFGPVAIDLVLAKLRSEEGRENSESLVAIARKYAPDPLRTLAIELSGGPIRTPEWVGEVLRDEAPEVRENAFERAWLALEAGGARMLSAEVVGPFANRHQTERNIVAWLRYCEERRNKLTDAEHERGRMIGALLTHAPGYDLLNVVIERGGDASYEESEELVEVLLRRVSRDAGRHSSGNQWLPTPDEFRQLFAVFSGKEERSRNPQDQLFILLANIASHVAPAEFGPLLLEALHRHLEAWSNYRTRLEEWLTSHEGPRPNNPMLGNNVVAALAKWGMASLPSLLQFMSHPCAMDLVPEAIGHIACLPWDSKRKSLSSNVSTDIKDGQHRSETGLNFQQPSVEYQSATDDAARTLSKVLNDELDRQLLEREHNPKWNAKQAKYQLGRLTRVLANLPSPDCIAPVTRALGSGLLGTFDFVNALKGLIKQGWSLSDANVVRELEALYQRESSPTWLDQSTTHAVGELCQFMFIVEPLTLLSAPLEYYLNQGQRFAPPSYLIQTLGHIKSKHAWSSLLILETDLSAKACLPDEFVYALTSSLTSEHFAEFANLISEGKLFSWCRNEWTVEHIAPSVARLVQNAPEHLSLLMDACRRNASPLADALAWKVLSAVSAAEETRMEIGLAAADAGRANHSDMPAYRLLMSMFSRKVPAGGNQFEVSPKACNPLRQHLYQRTRGDGPATEGARRMLACLECMRREDGRPIDETRHPEPNHELAWTEALV
ncbi:hypothetical protein DB032_13340 [Chromobacterium sp. Panama]|nr:hypothetical protein DB032_13340 [Chromobacterium sp. Panama]